MTPWSSKSPRKRHSGKQTPCRRSTGHIDICDNSVASIVGDATTIDLIAQASTILTPKMPVDFLLCWKSGGRRLTLRHGRTIHRFQRQKNYFPPIPRLFFWCVFPLLGTKLQKKLHAVAALSDRHVSISNCPAAHAATCNCKQKRSLRPF
jgi:hypothetical protein